MKYIILESQLDNVLNKLKKHLFTILNSFGSYRSDNFIIIWRLTDDDDDEVSQIMEYDYWDGRLWILTEYLKNLKQSFPFDEKELKSIIKEWFEMKYNVKVKYVA